MNINDMSLADLSALNHQVVERIRQLQAGRQQAAMQSLYVGDRVKFVARGGYVEGTIMKMNRKTVSVRTATTTWRVSPSLLSRVTAVA